MAAATFTLKAGDGLAARIGTTRTELAGVQVMLKAGIRTGGMVVIDEGLEVIDNVIVILDGDGKINGDTGVELLADAESLGLSAPLEWQVSFKGATSRGFAKPLTPWSFDAPASGATVNLADVMPPPGQLSNRGPAAYRIVGGSFDENGDLVLVNQDDSTIGPMTPPEGGLFIVDNGDGTAAIG